MSFAQLRALFDHIDIRLSQHDCDHTLRFTLQFVHEHQLPQAAVIAWIESYGGCCDCEVLANVEPAIEDALPES